MKRPAPVFVDALRLGAWLHQALGARTDPLSQRAVHGGAELLERVVLALRGADLDHALEDADRALHRLRARLRLAVEAELLTAAQGVHAFGIADSIGNQLGGWQRSLRNR